MWKRAWPAVLAFIALVPFVSEAQQPPRPYRIGVLNEAWAANHPTVEGLKAGLRELGFSEGRDVTFDVRFTEGKSDGLGDGRGVRAEDRVHLVPGDELFVDGDRRGGSRRIVLHEQLDPAGQHATFLVRVLDAELVVKGGRERENTRGGNAGPGGRDHPLIRSPAGRRRGPVHD